MCWFVTAASCGALIVVDSDESDGLTSGVTTDTVLVTCADGYSASVSGDSPFTVSCDASGVGTSAWTGLETCDGILFTHTSLYLISSVFFLLCVGL